MDSNDTILVKLVAAYQNGTRFDRETLDTLKAIRDKGGESKLDEMFMAAGQIAMEKSLKEKQPPMATIRRL